MTSELNGVNKLTAVTHKYFVLPPISEVIQVSKTLAGRAHEVGKSIVVLWKEGYPGLARGKPRLEIENVVGIPIPDALGRHSYAPENEILRSLIVSRREGGLTLGPKRAPSLKSVKVCM